MWLLKGSYCLENARIRSPFILGFHQNLSKILIFISQSPPFYENPISSVRPSETQKGRFLCVHPHSGGVVGFSIIGFSSMTPPQVTAATAAAANPRRSFLQGPGPAHHSHPGTKYPVRGNPSLRRKVPLERRQSIADSGHGFCASLFPLFLTFMTASCCLHRSRFSYLFLSLSFSPADLPLHC